MQHRARSWWTMAGAGALALLVVALPLLRGGVGDSGVAASLGLAVLALGLSAHGAAALPLPAAGLAAIVALLALQVTPLPPAWHGISPAARALFDANLGPLGLYPAARPVSLDPPATWLELARACAGLAAFAAAWLIGRSQRRRRVLLLALPVAGLAVAAVVLGRPLAGLGPLLSPTYPFVNPNHLAAFMGLASYATLGIALREHGQRRLLWLMAFALMASLVPLSLSRGGVAAFVTGVGILAVLARRRSAREDEPPSRRHLAVVSAMLASTAITAWLAFGPLMREASSLTRAGAADKLAVWPLGVAMVRDYPLVGIGRGAFVTAFPAYKSDSLQVTWTYLENEWLQAFVELGVPGGVLLIASFLLSWVVAARRRELSWADIGLLTGVAVVALQSVVDFSLQLPGVSIPFLVALGLAMRGSLPFSASSRLVLAAGVCLGSLGAFGLVVFRAHPTDLDAASVARVVDADEARRAAQPVILHHPADWLPQAAVGQRLVEDGRCSEAVPWLTRAMLLNPTAHHPHLYMARCLAASGQGTYARREYRLALVFGSTMALPEAVRLYSGLEELLSLVPDTPEGLMLLGSHLIRDRPEEATAVYRRAWAEYAVPAAALPLATALFKTGAVDEALELAEGRTRTAPGDAAAWRLLGSILDSLDRGDDATAALERGLTANPGSPAILSLLAGRFLGSGRFAEARRAAEAIAATTPAELASKHLLVAQTLAGQGRLVEAIDRARTAAAIQPAAAGPLLSLAAYCQAANRFDDAIRAIDTLAALPGQDRAALTARMVAIRAAQEEHRLRRLRQRPDQPGAH